MPTYLIVSTSGKSLTACNTIAELEEHHKALLDRREELEAQVTDLQHRLNNALKDLGNYVKDERP